MLVSTITVESQKSKVESREQNSKMAKIGKFEDIEAWSKARKLTQAIYDISGKGQFAKDWGLRDQICRASVSIMSNIAEGFERRSDKQFVQYLSVAKGSCGEVRAQLYVALDQGYLDQEQFKVYTELAGEVSRMIYGLVKYLRNPTCKESR